MRSTPHVATYGASLRIETLIAALCGACVALRPAPASAQEAKSDKPPAPEYKVDFRADRVDIEPDSSELALSGNVVVTVARYRIESERISLSRGPRGLEVEGSGEVALCPCEDAPLTLGFQAATVAPPTDVLLEQPTVRIGGLPVLWLPYLWLRARDRLGVLPPWVEFRGDEGLLLGSGVHVPVGGRSYRGRAAALDLRGGGYLQGGGRVDALLDTSSARTRAVWDHLDDTALRLEAAGSLEAGAGATVAWMADAHRGGRGRQYPSSLDQAARRFDRAALTVGHAERVVAGFGLQATDARAGALDSLGSAGPRLYWGAGSELGQGVAADAALDVTTVQSELGSRSDAVGSLALELDAPVAPLALGAELRQRVRASAAGSSSRAVLEQGLFPRLSLPLYRNFGEITHTVEPIVSGGHVLSVGSEPVAGLWQPWPAREVVASEQGEEVWSVGAGLQTALGSSRQAVTLLASGGFVGGSELLPAVAGELRSDLRLLGLSVQAAALEQRGSAVAQVRMGKVDGFRAGLRADASTSGGAGEAQWLLPDAWDSFTPFLLEEGVSLGGEVGVPWTSWLASEVTADYDASAERLLAIGSSLSYRHPCGCVSAVGWAGQRVGRGGVDAWLGIDLLP